MATSKLPKNVFDLIIEGDAGYGNMEVVEIELITKPSKSRFQAQFRWLDEERDAWVEPYTIFSDYDEIVANQGVRRSALWKLWWYSMYPISHLKSYDFINDELSEKQMFICKERNQERFEYIIPIIDQFSDTFIVHEEFVKGLYEDPLYYELLSVKSDNRAYFIAHLSGSDYKYEFNCPVHDILYLADARPL